MIYNETFDYVWSTLAGAGDAAATTRLNDYQRKRLRRALLSRSIKPYFLEARWTNTAGTAGEESVAVTAPVTEPLMVIDGAIRTSNPTFVAGRGAQLGTQEDFNNFELQLFRTSGDSRVQMMQGFIKDEHLLVPAQAALRSYVRRGRLGQGAPYPVTWPVPLRLAPNELIQVTSRVLQGGLPADRTTFCQFRAVSADNRAEEDSFVRDLEAQIKARPIQKPYFLSMFSENARSIAFPATGALQRTVAKTREAPEHLLVLGYAALFARSTGLEDGGVKMTTGSTCSPRWRLQSSDGYAFSREEIDVACYEYPGPSYFWREFPQPFLLRKGCSLSASFSTLTAIQNALEQIDNYVYFRCVSV